PGLLACAHQRRPACSATREAGVSCVIVLHAGASAIADTFAGVVKTADGDKFSCAEWHTLETGAPVVERPLVAFDCRLGLATQWRTHFIFVGEVAAVQLAESAPLLYGRRTYGRFAPLQAVAG